MSACKAGRPRLGSLPRVTVALSVDRDVLRLVDAQAHVWRVSRSQAVHVLLSGALGVDVGVALVT